MFEKLAGAERVKQGQQSYIVSGGEAHWSLDTGWEGVENISSC